MSTPLQVIIHHKLPYTHAYDNIFLSINSILSTSSHSSCGKKKYQLLRIQHGFSS
jgi:hypothetical protein